MIEFIPIRDRLLVKKIEDSMKTKSGLVLSDDTKERPTKGEVLSVGEGKLNDDGKLIPMAVSKGDKIVYPKYAGHPIKLDGIEYLILDENEVLGIIKGELNNG
jgi:chaperonin GroES